MIKMPTKRARPVAYDAQGFPLYAGQPISQNGALDYNTTGGPLWRRFAGRVADRSPAGGLGGVGGTPVDMHISTPGFDPILILLPPQSVSGEPGRTAAGIIGDRFLASTGYQRHQSARSLATLLASRQLPEDMRREILEASGLYNPRIGLAAMGHQRRMKRKRRAKGGRK